MYFVIDKKLVAYIFAGLFVALSFLEPVVCYGQEYGEFVDKRDNTTYKTVEFGKKIWMSENLRYLPAVSTPESIDEEDYYNEKYYVYGYNGTDVAEAKETDEYKTYGVLYNQKAAKSACPDGWHLPKDSEWKSIEKELGMKGSAIKEIGNRGTTQGITMAGRPELWVIKGKVLFVNNLLGFGKSNFMALPAGFLGIDKKFHELGGKTCFWSSTEYCEGYSYYRSIGVNSLAVYRNNNDNRAGMSVRCIKN